MGNYKVPQDVEAEDKLIGPFSFRQFIFLLIAALLAFVGWLLGKLNGWLFFIPMPLTLFFTFIGLYHREDQPVETYLFAAVSYFFKPHKRVWDPEGKVEHVKVVIPPKPAGPKLKNLGREERGQLSKLAHVMDTRGWSAKRPELNEAVTDQSIDNSDRLARVAVDRVPQDTLDIHASDDLLDPINFPDAQKYRQLAESTSTQARAQAIRTMKQAAKMDTKGTSDKIQDTNGSPPLTPSPKAEKPQPNTTVPTGPSPVHAELAKDNGLSVHQLARRAEQLTKEQGILEAGQEIDLPNAGEPAV